MNIKFAEIEYEITPLVDTQKIAPKVIKPQQSDPIRDKFTAMRRIFYDNPYSRNDAELFYKQMQFMQDYEDDYEGCEPFSMYYPNYQFMSHEQLRTYFTWRANVRRGEILLIPHSYVFLYIYELLANIGVESPSQGLSQILKLWHIFKNEIRGFWKFIFPWFKDYHIYYNLDFDAFVREHNLTSRYPECYIQETTPDNCLFLWNEISYCDIKDSPFYKKGNQKLMEEYFYIVVKVIEEKCDIINMLTNVIQMSLPWKPFPTSLFYPWLEQPDRKVILPGKEAFYCKNNIWTADIAVYSRINRDHIAGYIIKKTEAVLRKCVGYRSFNPKTSKSAYAIRGFRRSRHTHLELDDVIEKAVNDYYENSKRTIVIVDTTNLSRIREEAQTTQDLLVVPETTDIPEPVGVVNRSLQPIEANLKIQISPWVGLKESLSPIEAEALRILIQDDSGFISFANANGIMPEVLLDGINEKSTDYIGDNILDEEFMIYNDYLSEITEMLCDSKANPAIHLG